jgi:putative ABC transport system permease protein
MFENNNRAIVRKITNRALRSDKRRNFFIVAAIALTAFMITSVFSVGMSWYETINTHEKRMQGSVSNMGFAAPTPEQLEKVYTLDYVRYVGIGAYVAYTFDFPKLHISNVRDRLEIGFVDKTQWEKMFCPTNTNIIGHFPERENEIMLSRYILDAMGIDNPSVGMEIPISYIVGGTEETITETFILSCIYTEYSHSGLSGGGGIAVLTSRAFAEKYDKLIPENIVVNVIFKNEKRMSENIERLKQDLDFYENQQTVQSPAFGDNYGNYTTYVALSTITAFLMLMGYLLIYNVMYISVSKDVRFYGMLKTLGTTPKQLRRIVIGQVLRLCLAGLPIGCVLAAGVSLLVVPAMIVSSGGNGGAAVVSFSPVIYLGAILFAVLTALFGAVTPAKKAANVSPIEALKFTGEQIKKSGVRSSANGKPYRMALRNIFRDRKRAVIVMLSLFLGIVVFTSILTIITSIDIEYLIQSEYAYDFSIEPGNGVVTLNEDFVNNAKALDGVTEAGITMFGTSEMVSSNALEQIIDFGEENFLFTLRGIDPLTFDRINKTLDKPIDKKAFERGEIALVNTREHYTDSIIADALTPGSILNIKSGEGEISVAVGGGSSDISLQSRISYGFGQNYGKLEIIVSNAFFPQVYTAVKGDPIPLIVRLDMNVEEGFDEQVFNALYEMIPPLTADMTSRYEVRKAMQDSKTVLYVLGGGISAILGFIGIFNFINVMSVGVMARKREFATLESVGMSKRQMRSMLRNEGLGYAIITIACALTLGNAITYGLFLLFKNAVADFAEFTYPLIPCAAVFAVIAAICLITSEIAYKGISKNTLVERLREVE